MIEIQVNNLVKSFEVGKNVLDGLTFQVDQGERVGLLGRNGAGKTTLFKILTGELDYDEGTVVVGQGRRVGLISQIPVYPAGFTVEDVLRSAFARLESLAEEMRALEARMAAGESDPAILKRYGTLSERFEAFGGYDTDVAVNKIANGLSIPDSQRSQLFDSLSGGEKTRVNLGRLILEDTDILLLDEPTNHLDLHATEWLEEYIRSFHGTVVTISHDRYFLDKVTQRTLEMEGKTLTSYKGNYSRYLELRAEHRLAMERVYENTQKEIARIEGIIEQQRRWNQERNYVTIASKQKQIDRLEATLERPEDEPESIRFQFKASRRGGNDVLTAQDLSLSFGGPPLFEHVDLEIKHGEKVFLIGPNGCGKTSLFKILLGQYTQDTGVVRLGSAIDVGYYEQSQLSLHDEKTVIDEIWDLHPQMTQTQVRSALAVFLFKGEDVFKPVGALSGGERARVLLLKLMLSKANFLLLDEPTNHLDIGSCEALEDALSGYDGTLFVVSHDRYLINKLADKVYVLGKNGAKLYLGNYDSYVEQRDREREAVEEQRPEPKVNLYKLRKERESNLRKKRTALTRLETEIEEKDRQVKELEQRLEDPEFAADYEAVAEASQEIARLHEEAEQLLLNWTELSQELEEMEAENQEGC